MSEQVVELNPGESKLVSFEAVPHEARTYQVNIDGLRDSFKAIAAPEPLPPFYLESIGTYISIHMKGPGSAKAGETFNIYVAMLNWDFPNNQPFIDLTLYGQPVISINGKPVINGSYEHIPPIRPVYNVTEYDFMPRQESSWKFTFTMPDGPFNIKADGWIEEEEWAFIPWHIDASVEAKVVLLLG